MDNKCKTCNLALDEVHECLINRKLKELTRNANEFNTVTLANFIAFLEQFLEKLTGFVYRHSKKILGITKSKHNRFLHVVRPKVHSLRLLASTTKRALVNSFNANAPPLDDEQRHDLLRIAVEGKSRMVTYIKQYMIKPPLEKPVKQRRNKLKTFSKRKNTVHGKLSQASRLSKMNKGLVKLVKQTG